MAHIIRALSPPARRIDAQVYEARLEAGRIVAEARSAAAELLRSAEAESLRIQAAARSAGREEGLGDARGTIAWAASERDRMLESAETDLVRLALGIAATVLRREAEGGGMVLEMARRALTEARDRTCVAIRVHPDDLAAARGEEADLARLVPRSCGIAWIADPAIARGGAVVETETGSIDARVESQLAAVRRILARRR